jgi:hypothetical protein
MRQACITALLSTSLLSPLRAAAAPSAPAASAQASSAVKIELISQPRLRLEVQDPRDGRPLAYCEGACQATIMPGRYRLFANATADTRAGGDEIEIEAPSHILIRPSSEARYKSGLALGIAGPTLIVLGLLLVGLNPGGGTHSELGTGDGGTVGLLLALGGIVITPIGWTLYGTSLGPKVTVTPLEP